MKYIACPEIYIPRKHEKSIFLAGGITGCADWQSELVELLKYEKITLLNPRRKHFPEGNKDELTQAQTTWEYEHFKKATAISFWFPKETLCPITLFELGKQITQKKFLFVGVDSKYKRRTDIEIQMQLARPETPIAYSLNDLAQQIKSCC